MKQLIGYANVTVFIMKKAVIMFFETPITAFFVKCETFISGHFRCILHLTFGIKKGLHKV